LSVFVWLIVLLHVAAVCVSVGSGKGASNCLGMEDKWRGLRGGGAVKGLLGWPGGGGVGGIVLCVQLKCLFNILKMGLWKSVCVSFSWMFWFAIFCMYF
jgi:hypothetical protein